MENNQEVKLTKDEEMEKKMDELDKNRKLLEHWEDEMKMEYRRQEAIMSQIIESKSEIKRNEDSLKEIQQRRFTSFK